MSIPERSTKQLLNELCEHVHTCCLLLVEVNNKLANQSSGVSSVNLKTSARGHDVDVKVYAGSEVTSAGDAAVAEYFRVAKEIEKRLMGEA